MRIVTWNMGCGFQRSGYRKFHDEAWDYLIKELRPDVALVQEACIARIEAQRQDSVISICDLAPGVDAGAAVLVRGFQAEPIPAPLQAGGTYIASARVTTTAGSFIAASIHVNPGKVHGAALRSLVENCGPAFGCETAVLAGDFNAARHFDRVYGGKHHTNFFAGMELGGFHDAHWNIHGKEIQSFWGRQAKELYQDDHFFVSKSSASRIQFCGVVDNPTVRRVSDHGPVVLELDVG